MPLPTTLAKFNRRVTNPVARRFAGRIPPFAIVEHRGRHSGARYRTPVVVFTSGDDFVVALTYGPGADWVRNVLAEGGCVLEHRRRRLPLTAPEIAHETAGLPAPVRVALRLLGATDVLRLRRGPVAG